MSKYPIPILLPKFCAAETTSLGEITWQLGVFLGDLEKTGIGWHQFPDDLQEIGTLNTACGGLSSNGARTSLRNLVVLEGIEFTRAFLSTANKGAKRLDWSMQYNPFLAELEWLDLVGDKATALLEDYDKNHHLLNAAEAAYSSAQRLHDVHRKSVLEALSDDVKQRILKAEEVTERTEWGGANNHLLRVASYVLSHPGLEFVPIEKHSDEPRAIWNARVKDCAEAIRKGSSFLNRMPIVNKLRNRKSMH